MINIYVPTYNRLEIPILNCLEDTNLSITLCLRHEEIRKKRSILKKYNKYSDRIFFVDLGKNIDNLGETRKRILQHCMCNNDRYCIMLDDSLTNVKVINENLSMSESLTKCLDFLKEKEKTDINVFCYNIFRQGNKFLGVDEKDEYFVGLPLQAVIINVEKCFLTALNYEDMKLSGLEDVAFFIDAVKRGLIFVSNQQITIEGKLPNTIIPGGSHSENAKEFELKRDKDHQILMNYVGNIYGIMLTKKYRPSLGFNLTYARIDFSYFRDVLVYNRKENEDIIRSKFKII